MLEQINLWSALAGLGIFLLGISMMENALDQLAGRSFTKFLQRNTKNPVKAVLAGTGVTAILQSSSVVGLMVLAFIGAGIIELSNALGIIIGSNLGTTFTGWIVAYFGFEFKIESFALPMLAIGGLSMVLFSKRERLLNAGRLLAGIGFLFMGLDYMKSGIEYITENFDISYYVGFGPYFLFVVGFVLTAIIQSSSAAMVITLSALNLGVISLPAAAAMVIGSDLGTTITVILGSLQGAAAKRRVALGQFTFNLIVDLIALALLFPILNVIVHVFNFSNPLYTLVAFHSCFNLLGILLFLPLLKPFARFLEQRFTRHQGSVLQFINTVPSNVLEPALIALSNEVRHLIHRGFHFNASILELNNHFLLEHKFTERNWEEQYESIKTLEGHLVEFIVDVQNNKLKKSESQQLNKLILATRYLMTSVKDLKDIQHNLRDFHRSPDDHLQKLLRLIQEHQTIFYHELYDYFTHPEDDPIHTELKDLKKTSKSNYTEFAERTYKLVHQDRFSEFEISTLFNVNREIHASNKALVQAVNNLLTRNIESIED